MFEIVIDEKAKNSGLASMIYQMIKENLEKNPWKEKFAKKINSEISIFAKDAEVKVSLSFRKDKVLIFDSEIFYPDIKISADTSDLIGMTKIKIISFLNILHIPILSKEDLDLFKKIINGGVKLELKNLGLKSLVSLFCLIIVLSVYP
jgi:ADP-dependent phosphofructokinase/glucokinase